MGKYSLYKDNGDLNKLCFMIDVNEEIDGIWDALDGKINLNTAYTNDETDEEVNLEEILESYGIYAYEFPFYSLLEEYQDVFIDDIIEDFFDSFDFEGPYHDLEKYYDDNDIDDRISKAELQTFISDRCSDIDPREYDTADMSILLKVSDIDDYFHRPTTIPYQERKEIEYIMINFIEYLNTRKSECDIKYRFTT